MADFISQLGTAGTWILSLFTELFTFIIGKPVLLFPIGVGILGGVLGIVMRVKRGFGLRSRRR